MNAMQHAAYVADAREAHALYRAMTTPQLLELQVAFALDAAGATQPETIAFSAGRLGLMADVLARRGWRPEHQTLASITCPVCQRISYNPHDVRQRYCGACHRFHDDPAGSLSKDQT